MHKWFPVAFLFLWVEAVVDLELGTSGGSTMIDKGADEWQRGMGVVVVVNLELGTYSAHLWWEGGRGVAGSYWEEVVVALIEER